jgi:hypothetical protein
MQVPESTNVYHSGNWGCSRVVLYQYVVPNKIVESVQMINQDMHKDAFLLLVGNDVEQCYEDQNNVEMSDGSGPGSSATYLLTICPV